MKERIQTAISGPVATAIGLDGRELEVTAFEDGIATVRLTGVCASCPASIPLLVQQIEAELKAVVPEVEMVEVTA